MNRIDYKCVIVFTSSKEKGDSTRTEIPGYGVDWMPS